MATRSEVAELSATELRDFLGSRNELAEETLQSLLEGWMIPCSRMCLNS